MTLNEYQAMAIRTKPIDTKPFVDRQHDILAEVLHAKLGIDDESGELAKMIKKHLVYGAPFDTENVLEECGDILWYVSLMLHACGYDMSYCAEQNINKLQLRYPKKFTEHDAIERKDKISPSS